MMIAKYLLIIFIPCYFFSCSKGCSSPYDYLYFLYVDNQKGITSDSIKIVFDTYQESGKIITKKIYPDTSIYNRKYMIFQEQLVYVRLDEAPKDLNSNFSHYLKRIKIYLDDSLVYTEDPIKISNWTNYNREANIFLGGGMDGAVYELQLDSLFKPKIN